MKMEVIKPANNAEFDVIYDDGTRKRVHEGVLIEVEDNAVTFHNGTNRVSVLFASVEALFEVIEVLGLSDAFEKYLSRSSEVSE